MDENLMWGLISVLTLIPSFAVHECAHAWVADKLGDDTAKRQGRVTLDPLAHLDPIGSVVLPLILAVTSGMTFGWAKPVPVDRSNFRHPRRDDLLVSIAGPAANLVLAIIATVVAGVLDVVIGLFALDALEVVWKIAVELAFVNLILLFFNLLPIPPLDGSAIWRFTLTGRALDRYAEVERYGFIVFFLVVFALPSASGFDPLSQYFGATALPLHSLLAALVGAA